MLGNTRIRTRLALMVAGPAVTAVILTAITFALVPRIAIGGKAYDQLMLGRDFQTGTASPSLYIIEIHSAVQNLTVQAVSDKPTAGLQSEITRSQDAYERAYEDWVGRLTDAQARNDLTASHEAATEYFRIYREQLLPALNEGRDSDAANLLETSMAQAMSSHRAAAVSAAERVERQVAAQEEAVAAQTLRQALGIVAVTVLIIAASTALGLTVLRSITDRVRRLNEIAGVELPQVLDEVKRAALAGEDIPSLPAPRGEGRDELAAAAVAFNSVVGTAVELAAEQSRLRRATSQMFINLGRRNHKLLSRTLTYITQLESDERDPAILQNLFRLDHLTTRMRRHAESLLVLAGSPPLRTWSRPVPVADVLRAALSEIETYDRVDIKELEPVEVRGASVSDLAHLLAELLENATAFSPPQTRVRVLGRIDPDGYTIVVVDEGIGMSPRELDAANDLINSPDDSGFLDDSRMLGLGVVGRLAARHGFKVSLTASPVGGVVAWVTLPTSALAPRRGGSDSDSATGPATAGLLPDGGLTSPSGTVDAEQAATAQHDARSRDVAEAAGAAPDEVSDSTTDESASKVTMNGTGAAAGLHPGALPLRPADDRESSAESPEPASADQGSDKDSEDADATVGANEQAAASGGPVTGSVALPPPAPEIASPTTGSVMIPPAPEVSPVSGPIAFRKPVPAPGESGTLTRRVRGAQLPDTGDAPATGSQPPSRPERSAQSVRGALQSFDAGRRTAVEVTIGKASPATGPISRTAAGAGQSRPSNPSPRDDRALPHDGPASVGGGKQRRGAAPSAGDDPVIVPSGQQLPRRVRGAQLPDTELPTASPVPERSAAEVRAALSNFVAGRRAAEHEDD